MEKTELEKRWESESVEDTVPADQQEPRYDHIQCPFADKDSVVPMVIVDCGGRNFVGGFLGFDDFDLCLLLLPQLYVELVSRSPDGNASLQVGVNKVFQALDIADQMPVRHNFIHFLKRTSPNDMQLARLYEEAIQRALLARSGLVQPPTGTDISKLKLN